MKIPLFDIDGTLLEGGGGNQAHKDGFDVAFKEVFHLPNAKISDVVTDGKIDKQILLEVVKLHGVPTGVAKSTMDEAIKVVQKHFFSNLDQSLCVAAPGVIKLLTLLREKNVTLGLLTGNIEAIALKKLEQAGLKDYFQFGAFGSLAYKRVDLIDIALTRLNALSSQQYQKSDLVIIGDSPLDVKCAQDGGIEVMAVASGNYSVKALEKTNPTVTVANLLDSAPVLSFLEVF